MSFNLAIVLPRWNTYCVSCGTQGVSPRTPSIHRLQHGLPGHLILFAPHAFAPHRQLSSSNPPSPLVFLLISTHFTATLGIPIASPILKKSSFKCSSRVEPVDFTSDLPSRLHALTPSKSGQRLPPTYYRGCWHVVSRGLFVRYRLLLVPDKRSLQPESLLPSRGVAGSGLRPLPNIPHCCLP